MITLPTTRQHTEAVLHQFFPFIRLYKQTRLNNVAHTTVQSEEYLSAMVINCILAEVDLMLQKKLLNTVSHKMVFKFTDAQGVMLYKSLLAIKLPDDFYLNTVRNLWIELLDKEIIRNNLYQLNKPIKPAPPRRTVSDFYSD